MARDEYGDDPAVLWESTTEAWTTYWDSLTVADRRALILGLGMRPLLHLTSAPRRLTNGALQAD